MKPPRLPHQNRPPAEPGKPSNPEQSTSERSVPQQNLPDNADPIDADKPSSRRRAIVEQLAGLRDSVSEAISKDVPESETHFRTQEAMQEAATKARNKHNKATVPARNLSGRLIALIVITVLMVLATIPSITTYVEQQAEIKELQADIDARKAEQEDLNTEIARWDDDAYVKQQARDRINLVMPGERKYLVIGELPETENEPAESPHDVRADMPWADALLDSIRRAGTD